METLLIYSGKGGVGKSTISYNIAYSLKLKGYKVGIFDADFNTPSIHKLIQGLPLNRKASINNFIISPAIYEKIRVQSTGFINDNSGIIWNEDYIEGAIYQLLSKEMTNVDYLIIDLPPGITEVHSQICKIFPESNVLLVISPNELSVEDLEKATNFLKKLEIDIIGTVINMDHLECEYCSYKNKLHIKELSSYRNLENLKNSNLFLEIPFSQDLLFSNEKGIPIVKNNPENKISEKIFHLTNYLTEENE